MHIHIVRQYFRTKSNYMGKIKYNNQRIDISIVIPAKNEGNYLKLCLDSIIKALGNNNTYEIIIVDNKSEDNSVEIAKKYNCKIIQNKKEGVGSSRNAGASIAKGEFIAFIDGDCILDEKWFQFTKEHFYHQRIAAVGTKICPNFNTATWVEETIFHLNNRRGVALSEEMVKVKWIGTSNMLVRKEDFDKIGGFNEDLITCEDYDLCTRLAEFGDIVLDKRIFTIHLRESKNLKELFKRELWRGQYSLRVWIKNNFKFYEASSILLPGFFLLCIVLGIITIPINFELSIFFGLFAFICPLMIVIRSKEARVNPLLFMRSLVISSTYLLARSISLLQELLELLRFKKNRPCDINHSQ